MARVIKAVPISGEAVLPHAAGLARKVPPVPEPEVRPVAMPPTPAVAVPKAPEQAPVDVRAQLEAESRDVLLSLEHEARERGFKEGLETGLKEGRQRGQSELASAVEALKAALQSVNSRAEEVIDAADEVIGAIAFEAVSKIVGDKLLTVEGVRSVVASVLASVKREDVVAIKVSESDYALLASEGAAGVGLPEMGIEPDPTIELGGAVVELRGGRVDGRIETQFRQFAQMIREAAHRRGAAS
jgi:flagellar biosynthesis/type III secretory pathway protein FliH